MRRAATALAVVLALLAGSAIAQTQPESPAPVPPPDTASPPPPRLSLAPGRDLMPLDQRLGRPVVLRLWRSNRAFLELNFAALDAGTGALAAEAPSPDIFDVDVFVMFLDSFQSPDGIEGHMFEPFVARELAAVRPGESLRIALAPLTRHSDGAQRDVGIVLLDTALLREVSDLCLSILIYDMARWFFGSPIRDGLARGTARAGACQREGWRDVDTARNFER